MGGGRLSNSFLSLCSRKLQATHVISRGLSGLRHQGCRRDGDPGKLTLFQNRFRMMVEHLPRIRRDNASFGTDQQLLVKLAF